MYAKGCLPILILCSSITSKHIKPDGRIIGGETCPRETSKFVVSITKSGFHFCGGSLIKLDMVMTAAHCMVDIEAVDVEVFVGVSKRTIHGTQKRTGKRIFIHTGRKNDKDIAIIQLDQAFKQSQDIDVVSLPSQKITNLEQKCPMGVVMGWGHKEVFDPDIKKPYPKYIWDGNLQCVSLSLLANSECQKYVPDRVAEWIFCAWYEPGGRDACMGDSGGPTMCGGIQIGIVSSGYGCGLPEKPAFYVRVDRMLDFINSKLNYQKGRKGSGNGTRFGFTLLALSISVHIYIRFHES